MRLQTTKQRYTLSLRLTFVPPGRWGGRGGGGQLRAETCLSVVNLSICPEWRTAPSPRSGQQQPGYFTLSRGKTKLLETNCQRHTANTHTRMWVSRPSLLTVHTHTHNLPSLSISQMEPPSLHRHYRIFNLFPPWDKRGKRLCPLLYAFKGFKHEARKKKRTCLKEEMS